jgi:hypothetical protein
MAQSSRSTSLRPGARVIPAIPLALGGKRKVKQAASAKVDAVTPKATPIVPAAESSSDVPAKDLNGHQGVDAVEEKEEKQEVGMPVKDEGENMQSVAGKGNGLNLDTSKSKNGDNEQVDGVVNTMGSEDLVLLAHGVEHDDETKVGAQLDQNEADEATAISSQPLGNTPALDLPVVSNGEPLIPNSQDELESDSPAAAPPQAAAIAPPHTNGDSASITTPSASTEQIPQEASVETSVGSTPGTMAAPPGLSKGMPNFYAHRAPEHMNGQSEIHPLANGFMPSAPPKIRPAFSPQTRQYDYNPQAPSYVRQPIQASNGMTPQGFDSEREAHGNFVNIEHQRRKSSLQELSEGAHPPSWTQPTPGTLDRNTGIADFIHFQFGSAEFADYILRLPLPPFNLPAHGLIIARSPRLRSLMAMPSYYPNGQGYPRMLDVRVSDRFLNHDVALIKALMRLYGEVLPDRNFALAIAATRAPHVVQQEAMRFALSLTAAGHFLQVEEIVMHGLSLSASLLSWETVTPVLCFALEGGLGAAFSQNADTTSGSDSSSRDGTNTPSKQADSPTSSPTYGIYSDRAMQNVLGFLLYNWPADFKLDEAAPQLQDIARLPVLSEPPTNHGRKSSRLSQIRFGEMMHEEQGAPSFVSTTLSSMLLTLPFQLLAYIFGGNVLGERLGWDNTAALMHSIIAEREQRRLRAVQHRRGGPPGLPLMAEDRLWSNTRWTEGVEPTDQHPARCRLVRRLSSSDTPSVLTPMEST